MTLARDVFGSARLAHISLKGTLPAERYTTGEMKRVIHPAARLHLDRESPATDRQILYGHKVCQLDPFAQITRDETSGYVGHVADGVLGIWAEPTHRVAARATLLFAAPDIKSPDPLPISAGSLLRIIEQDGALARTHDGRYVPAAHLTDAARPEPDLAATAALLLGTPYLWGGNSAFGIDCSGLVQLACEAAHIPCPGDSDQQMAALGTELPEGTPPMRGDLMFWKGHVAIVHDPDTLIHANAGAMAVALEPLRDAVNRIRAQGEGAPLAHKRL